MLCNYGYSPDIYKATGIFPGDLECYLVSTFRKDILYEKFSPGQMHGSSEHDEKGIVEET